MICLSAAAAFAAPPKSPQRQDPITPAGDPGVCLVGTAPGWGGEGVRVAAGLRGC